MSPWLFFFLTLHCVRHTTTFPNFRARGRWAILVTWTQLKASRCKLENVP